MSLQRTVGCLLCLVILIATGCGQDGDNDATDFTDDVTYMALMGVVVINDTGDAVGQWGSDPYVIREDGGDALEEDGLVIDDDTLTVTVSYGGGCEVHDFTLVTAGKFPVSDPVQLQVSLAHDANGDSCEAYLTEKYEFDLTPIRNLYRSAYQSDTGTIVLNIGAAPEPAFEVPYTLRGIIQ